MSPINSRAKGKRGELLAVGVLGVLWPKAHRSASQGAGGDNAPDLEGTPWWAEVKNGVIPSPWKAMEQAERDRLLAEDARLPLVVCHRTRGPATVRGLVCFREQDLVAVALLFAEAVQRMTERTTKVDEP